MFEWNLILSVADQLIEGWLGIRWAVLAVSLHVAWRSQRFRSLALCVAVLMALDLILTVHPGRIEAPAAPAGAAPTPSR